MAIIVNSPYSGLPVKVRDQDVSRALRDEDGRVFYAVQKSDGSGYYGSPTRQGSAKDEQRAEDLAAKMSQSKTSGAEQTRRQLHDATGKRRGKLRHYAVLLIVLGAIAAGVWYFFFHTPQGASMLPDSLQPPDSPSSLLDTSPSDEALRAVSSEPTVKPWVTTATGLRYRIDEPGTSAVRAAAGNFVRVQYAVARPDTGEILESCGETGTVGFVLWSGQAMRAWDEAVAGMREGEVRTILVPADQLVGDWPGRKLAQLPGGALQFEVAVLEVLAGVTHDIVREGGGMMALPGDRVEMQYIASLAGSDEAYDDSHRRHAPLRFRIGAGEVIAGWELGVAGMREGETRRLTIPSYLAYGSRGAGQLIPPDATLNVEVELVRILSDDDRADQALTRAIRR